MNQKVRYGWEADWISTIVQSATSTGWELTVNRTADDSEIERRVDEVFNVVGQFSWADLRKRAPVGYDYSRPNAEGSYMAVGWRARWVDKLDGPIVIEVAGWQDEDHHHPLLTRSKIIGPRPTWLTRLFRR